MCPAKSSKSLSGKILPTQAVGQVHIQGSESTHVNNQPLIDIGPVSLEEAGIAAGMSLGEDPHMEKVCARVFVVITAVMGP
jgi:hypothetical protein